MITTGIFSFLGAASFHSLATLELFLPGELYSDQNLAILICVQSYVLLAVPE